MLDVAYDNGYSTINRHLSAFVGDVARRVEDLQYEKESWEVEITPEPDEYPVKAGQIIALSGNTGYSFGPHLHLDMIETATDEYIDPLPFFMDKVKDKTAPRAEGIMLFPQPGKGVVEGKPVSICGYFKGNMRTHLVGVLGGVIWCIGQSFSMIASEKAGAAISYGLGQGATLVSALWGILIWKEFKGAPAISNRLNVGMFILFVIGLGF